MAQAFKESLSLATVARAMAAGVRAAGAEAQVILGSDGGDGLLPALEPVLIRTTRHPGEDPLRRPIEVPAGWLGDGT
ncbi:MAG: glycerate kinase, partial [Gammaproteobacteria bacterium]|nr:glycerate kinase [Gammaproteobacteria bacterium]